jgi:hypothetical protein
MKLIVMGHARHGKDTVSEILCSLLDLSFKSSSEILNEEVVFPALKAKYGYANHEECFLDRVNHREEWFNLLVEYDTPDPARLGKLIFASYDIYCGLRNRDELIAIKNTCDIDHILWVERPGVTEEPETSCTVTREDADYIIYNDGDLQELQDNLEWLVATRKWDLG